MISNLHSTETKRTAKLSKMFCDNYGYHLGETIGLFCEECGASLLPRNLTETELLSQKNNEQEIIKKYFNDGYDYNMINTILAKRYRINMSLRTLKRQLQVYGLKISKFF